MKKRWIGYAAWLMLAVCLYFFENNTGTRVVLLCSLFFPFVPSLRAALLLPEEPAMETVQETLTVRMFTHRKPEEPDNIRPYIPGDPVRRIHWKLTAKKGELLIRDTTAGQEETEEERKLVFPAKKRGKRNGVHYAVWLAAGTTICMILLLLIPEASRGAQELCNRVFAASEKVNRYEYRYFTVPENQSVFTAAFLLLCILALVLALTAILRNRLLALGMTAAVTVFQIYFGLPFPWWINIPLYGLIALWMLGKPAGHSRITVYCVLLIVTSVLVIFLLPGVDAATEEASEAVRDYLAEAAGQADGMVPEVPEGETETRHIHTRSMENGEQISETERVFRLVTVEEEQISMPHWADWNKIILLLMLAVALVVLPFTPFLLLNARKRKAQEARKAIGSDDVSEAVRAAFQQVILWLEAVGYGAGNLLYRDWTGLLPDCFPEMYRNRFLQCAADYEEAAYSNHTMPEQKRRNALNLLKETETALWKAADWKQRLYLKYWMCLYE